MTWSPGVRRALLVAHVATSVGWLGAVTASLGISLVGLVADDEQLARAAYLVLEPVGRYVLVPLAVATLVTGVVQSLGSRWGLLLHWWVVFKLAITLLAGAILLAYLATFDAMATAAADRSLRLADVRNPSPVLHATLALVGLLVATVLAIVKPRGRTRRGMRRSATQAFE